MLCPDCQAPIDSDAVFCGHCGAALPPTSAGVSGSGAADEHAQPRQGEQWHNDIVGDVLQQDTHNLSSVSTAQYPLTPIPANASPSALTDQIAGQNNVSIPSLPASYLRKERTNSPSSTGRNLLSLAVILALLGVGIAATVFTFWQNKSLVYKATPAKSVAIPTMQGIVTFHDSASGMTNSLAISTQGLNPLHNSKAHYEAWIIDEDEVHIHSLGTLVKTGTTYALTFVDSNTNVLSLGNKIQVTLETAQTSLPTGRIMLSAQIPVAVMSHVDALLVSYPTTPHQVALLPGLRSQAQLISSESQKLSATNSQTANRCIAQNILTTLAGQRPTHEVVSAQRCSAVHIPQVPLDLGLLGSNNNGYVDIVGVRASLASSQPDATNNVRQSAQHVMITTTNLQQWFTAIQQDATSLLQNPTQASTMRTITQLSAYALNGVDSNNDGKISPTAGEAGVTQAYLYGQSMATLTLTTTIAK